MNKQSNPFYRFCCLFCCLFFCLLLGSCTTSQSPQTTQPAPQKSEPVSQQVAVVNRFLKALTDNDIVTMESLLTEEFTYTWIPTVSAAISPPSGVSGRDAYLQPLRERINSSNGGSGLTMEVINSSVMGNTILQERIDTFVTPGGPLSWHTSSFFLVIDGKIHEWGDYEWP